MMKNFYKTPLALGVAMVWGAVSLEAMAATPVTGDILTITGTTTTSGTWTTGSYFGMDSNGNSKIADSEKTALTSTGVIGLKIGVTTSGGASHSGPVAGGDTGTIDAPWAFFGNTGSDFVVTAVTGSTTAGLNMSGWRVTWNGIASINMGTGAWVTGAGAGHTGVTGTFTNGVGNFTWDGVYGHAYSLNYRATVPAGDVSGFGNVKYELHIEGVVRSGSVIVASTAPASGATGLASNLAKYVVNFGAPMNTTTILAGAISVSGGVTVGAPSCLSNKLTCVFPLTGVGASTTYTVTFNAGPLADGTGTALTLPAAKTFVTGAGADNTAPTVTVTPAASATSVAVSSAITLVFSEVMDPAAVASAFSFTGPSGAVAGVLSSSDNITFTFTPTANLTAAANYTVALTTAAKDLANNALATTSSTFTTAGAVAASTAVLESAGKAGGGCAMNPVGRFDFSLLLATLAGLGYSSWKRKRG